MKKTPFLSYILAALLACSAIPQAHAAEIALYDGGDHNIFDVDDQGGNNDWENVRYMYVDFGETINVFSSSSIIRNGGVSGRINIYKYGKLTMAAAGNGLAAGELIQSMHSDSSLFEWYYGGGYTWPTDYLSIWMQDGSALDYRDQELYLGVFTFELGATVDITAGMLSVKSIANTNRDFNINPHINLRNQAGNIGTLNIENNSAKTIYLNFDHTMNLRVTKGHVDVKLYIEDSTGKITLDTSGWDYKNMCDDPDYSKTQLNGATLTLPDGQTSYIEGYLGGDSWISLGNGTTLQGLYQARGDGKHDISVLVKNINVQGTNAKMTKGYYSGHIDMYAGSSLTFDMDVLPAHVDSAKPWGGAQIYMYGNNTLDLATRRTDLLDITIFHWGNTIKNGTLTGSYTLDNAGLTTLADIADTARFTLTNGSTLDLGGRYQNFGLTVSGKGNTLQNGAFVGTLTMEKNSSLVANNSLVSWGGPTSLILNDGSKLEMSGSDPWINRLPALQVNGEAIINGAFLRVRSAITPDWEYTLTEGVANLKGRDTYYVLTGDDGKDYFNLGGHTTNFDIIVWEADNRADIVIKNGTINTNVNMYGTNTSRPYNKLKLENVTLGERASFSLGYGVELDLGGAERTVWLGPTNASKATVSNGRIGMPGGQNGAMDYTLDFENGRPSALVGNGVTLNLGENIKFETKPKTRYLVSRSCIGNPSRKVKIDVRADGQFILGNSLNESGEYAINTIYGDVSVSHTGGNLSSGVTYDVDVAYRVMGDVTAAMNGGKINAGIIGYEDASGATTKGGTLTVTGASVVSVTSFIGKSMSLQSSGPVTLIGNARAFGTGGNDRGSLTVGGPDGTAPDINFQSNLSGGTITLTGRNISGTGSYGDMNSGATFVDFADICTINASGAIGINEGFKGGALKVTGGGNVVLDLLGKEGATLSSAVVTSHTGDVVMRSFTGGTLKAKANGALIVGRDSASGYPLSVTGLPAGGNVAASGIPAWDSTQQHAVELEGASVNIRGSLSASSNADYIKSGSGDITIGGNLSAGVSSTLESAANITVGGNVTGGALEAAAVQSISMQNIGIGDKDALLTATNGSITAGNFTGGTLKANAKAALTFNGAVEASGAGKWQPAAGGTAPYAVVLEGGSVSIGGNLAAGSGKDYIRSTAGDIGITGTLNANDSSTLESARNITVGGDVTGGALTGKAAQSISMQNISIGGKAAMLTATNGGITAGNFIGGDLTGTARQFIQLGNIGTSTQAAGNAVLTATDGSITAGSFNGDVLRADATGDVTINGSAAASTGATLMGSGVSVKGSLTSSDGRHYIKSSAGDIGITGTLNAEISSFLESAKNITIGGDATVGALTATAAKSIQMQNISIGANDAVLTATGGSITAGAFTGGALKANANATLTLNGNVVASGADKWQLTTAADAPKYAVVLEGGSVSIGGNLAANEGKNYVKGTAGDIAITGTLNAKDSSTLDSAANITVDGDVTGGALTATAGQAIQLKDISIGAKNAELTATGSSITAGNFIGGNLTASAGQSITLQHIGATGQAAGTVQLTATGSSITAGNVTAGMLTAGAAGAITMADVKASQTGSSIVSTGEDANVALNSFSGAGAQIKASQGSVTVASSVSGAAANAKNTFTAKGSVSFNGATGVNNLSHADIHAPQVNWSNGTTLADVTVSHWAPSPAKSPRLLLAAAGTGSAATVNVNGFLTLTENSTVNGNVVINRQDNVEPIVTVDHSTITGQVSGATKLVLDSGSVGSAARGETETLTVVSSGTSAITALTDGQPIDYLTMNGGSLTVTNQGGSTGQVLVTELTVTENSALNSDMELQASGEATLTFDHLTAANETTAVLTMDGELTSNAEGSSHGGNASNITICLSGNEEVEGGKKYALISLINREEIGTPDFWDNVDLTPHVQFNAKATDKNFFWEGNTLYYQNGGELKAAIWAPTQESHQWNTADKNWLQDDVRYRYKDGVTTVFDDTAFNLLDGYEGDVHLESAYAPKKVQVNNSADNDYTFMGDGAIGGTAKLTKEGAGTLTITNANSYTGGTTITAGTLDAAHAGALGTGAVSVEGGTLRVSFTSQQTPSFGTVTLTGGTVQIANGDKAFNLYVNSNNACMEGDYNNAFTGSLTLKEGSSLSVDGALSGKNGMAKIEMGYQSSLAMTQIDGLNNRIWINRVSEFTVDSEATLADVFLCLGPDGEYTLGTTMGNNVNSLQNLRGTGVTAYYLDGSTLVLNEQTNHLNIVARKENSSNDNLNCVMNGKLTTKVDIRSNCNLYLDNVIIESNATFCMGEGAYLNMGGYNYVSAKLSVFSFDAAGSGATIDNGTLLLAPNEAVSLQTNLRGTDTYFSLGNKSIFNLARHSLSINAVKLDANAASATIVNGTLNSGVTIADGQTLHLDDGLTQKGAAVQLESGASLGLGNDTRVEGAVSGRGTIVKEDGVIASATGSTATITGSMKDFKGNLEVRGGTLNLMNIAEAAQLNVADVAIHSGTLGVYKGDTAAAANEGTLTISNGHTLTAGQEALLNADLVMGGGEEGAAVLDVHAMAGLGGLQMGSTVTLNPGLVLLSAEDMAAVSGLRYMGKYDLFHGVDGLSLDGTPDFLSELGLADKWVKAADVFGNDLFQNAEDQYYVFYSGATQAGGKGGNVGTVYLMQVPEPTTSTLSLLALCALAARRRRKD